ncbi:hypothetical protein E5288_WYG007730 [Bos mutus]|uniref:Serine/arginine-rich splicing factor 2 n=1 Tax=Bos mutus TaxID=72004 RepID=A0A6B0RCP4_9CETA|nr:hypothetical protein [Bos mutus]
MSYGRPPPDVEGMTSLKVDNLTYRTSPDTLRRVFEKYGRVGDVYIPRDRYTKESRGFAFVRFHDKRDAEDAMDAMDGAVLDGRELRVQMARYGRPPDSHHSRRGPPPRRYGGGGYGRRSRRDQFLWACIGADVSTSNIKEDLGERTTYSVVLSPSEESLEQATGY